MSEYITKEQAFGLLPEGSLWALKALDELPPADVQPVIHAKWIIKDKEYNRIWLCQCSQCEKDPQDYVGGTENWWLTRLPKYCPNCGAKMDKEED